MAPIRDSGSDSASGSEQGAGPGPERKPLLGEESEPSPKYIHVHRYKGTGLYGAWFNDPTLRGKKKRLYFGSHQTAYLAARAQDRAALKYRPHAVDPSTIRLNFKEEDYLQDEFLRNMLTNKEFGELLCKESRLNYTKMERTPCLLQFYTEEVAKGNLEDDQASKPIKLTLQQYLDKVMRKRRCPKKKKKKVKKPSNNPSAAPAPMVRLYNLRARDHVIHKRRCPAGKKNVKNPSEALALAGLAPAVPLNNLQVQASHFSSDFPLDCAKIPKKKRSKRPGHGSKTTEPAAASATAFRRSRAVGALPQKRIVEAATTSWQPSLTRARKLPKDRNDPKDPIWETVQGSDKDASNPAAKSSTQLNKTKKRSLEEPKADGKKKMRSLEQLPLRDEKNKQQRMEDPKAAETNSQPRMEVPKAADKSKQPRMEVPKAAQKIKHPRIQEPKAAQTNKQPRMDNTKAADKKKKKPRMEELKAAEKNKQPRMEVPQAAHKNKHTRIEVPKAASKNKHPRIEVSKAAQKNTQVTQPRIENTKAAEKKKKKPRMEDPQAAQQKEKPTMEDLEAAGTLAAGLCAAQQTLPNQKIYSNKWAYKTNAIRAKASMGLAAASASASQSSGAQGPTVAEASTPKLHEFVQEELTELDLTTAEVFKELKFRRQF